eukprot:365249-Chlamydomonas_euryale.AAC.20
MWLRVSGTTHIVLRLVIPLTRKAAADTAAEGVSGGLPGQRYRTYPSSMAMFGAWLSRSMKAGSTWSTNKFYVELRIASECGNH